MVSLDCNVCRFKLQCLYSKITSQITRVRWNELKRTRIYQKNESIFNEGEIPNSFFCVCKGRVKITKSSSSGDSIIIGIRNPGMMFGYACLCRDSSYITSSKAMNESLISVFHKDVWTDLLKSDFEFSIELMRLFCAEIGNLQTRLATMAYQSAEEKIASVLLNHISFTTQSTPTPTVYNIKRNEIAELCGLRVETVVRTLQKLERKKIIKRESHAIKILQIKQLIELKGENSNSY